MHKKPPRDGLLVDAPLPPCVSPLLPPSLLGRTAWFRRLLPRGIRIGWYRVAIPGPVAGRTIVAVLRGRPPTGGIRTGFVNVSNHDARLLEPHIQIAFWLQFAPRVQPAVRAVSQLLRLGKRHRRMGTSPHEKRRQPL